MPLKTKGKNQKGKLNATLDLISSSGQECGELGHTCLLPWCWVEWRRSSCPPGSYPASWAVWRGSSNCPGHPSWPFGSRAFRRSTRRCTTWRSNGSGWACSPCTRRMRELRTRTRNDKELQTRRRFRKNLLPSLNYSETKPLQLVNLFDKLADRMRRKFGRS